MYVTRQGSHDAGRESKTGGTKPNDTTTTRTRHGWQAHDGEPNTRQLFDNSNGHSGLRPTLVIPSTPKPNKVLAPTGTQVWLARDRDKHSNLDIATNGNGSQHNANTRKRVSAYQKGVTLWKRR